MLLRDREPGQARWMPTHMIPHEHIFYVVMALAVCILGLSKGGFAGIGAISTPLIAAFSDPATAVGLMLPIMLIQDPVSVFMYRGSFEWRILARMVPGALAGVILAYLFAATVPIWGMTLTLGIISITFSLWQLIRIRLRLPSKVFSPRIDQIFGYLAGAGAGFSSTIAHAGTPPFQIYVLPKRLPRETYVGTSVLFFFCVNLMKLPAFAALNLVTTHSLIISLAFVPIAVISSWVGVLLVRRIALDRFVIASNLILLGIGIWLLVEGLNH